MIIYLNFKKGMCRGFSEEEKEMPRGIELEKRVILDWKEVGWRMKSMVVGFKRGRKYKKFP